MSMPTLLCLAVTPVSSHSLHKSAHSTAVPRLTAEDHMTRPPTGEEALGTEEADAEP